MELGLTIPLQKRLCLPPLSLSAQKDSFCWDLHLIRLHGRDSLLSVHCPSRYAFVLFDPSAAQWENLAPLFLSGLRASVSDAGISLKTLDVYLSEAGPISMTKTHGRREVAFLNRAWEDVLRFDHFTDPSSLFQPLLDRAVNQKPSRAAGCKDPAPAMRRLPELLF